MSDLNAIAQTIAGAKTEYSAKVRILMFELTTAENTFDVADIVGQVEELSEAMGQFLVALEALQEANTDAGGAVEHFIDCMGMEISDTTEAEDTLQAFQSAFIGETDMREYAETIAEEIKDQYGMSDMHGAYIDVYSIVRDLDAGGDVVESGPFLFSSNW